MLEDVWHACRIWWIRLESDAEDIVDIVSCYMQVVCTCLVMLEKQCRQL